MTKSLLHKDSTPDDLSLRFMAAAKDERMLGSRITGLERRIIARLFMAATVVRCYGFAGYALLKTVTRPQVPHDGAARLWILGKEGLNQDMAAVQSQRNDLDLCDFSRLCLKLLSEHRLPAWMDDNFYASDDIKDIHAKASLRNEWQKILSKLPRGERPAAILTSNFGYLYEREFAAACEVARIPFLAFHKECFKSEGRQEFFATTYRHRGAFGGRRIFVYNNFERDLLVKTGIAPLGKITVTGMPRLDYIHAWRRAGGFKHLAFQPTVLVFGFSTQSGLPRLPRKARTGIDDDQQALDNEFSGLRWSDLFTNYHAAILKLAHDFPHINVILKTKARERDGRPSVDFLREQGMPSNLDIVIGGDPVDLIKQSHCVIGFNTTALCEAIAAGIPVIVPAFDEAIAPETARYVPDLGYAVIKADSPDAMIRKAAEFSMKRTMPAVNLTTVAVQQLERWVGNPDGLAGERAYLAIVSETGREVI